MIFGKPPGKWLYFGEKDLAIVSALMADGFAEDNVLTDGTELVDAIGEVQGWLIARLCYTGLVLCFPPQSHYTHCRCEYCLSKDYCPGSDESDWLEPGKYPWGLPRIGFDTFFGIKELIEKAGHSVPEGGEKQTVAIAIWGGVQCQ